MKIVRVSLERYEHDIYIGAGLIRQLPEKLKGFGFRDKAVIITNSTINSLYGNSIKAGLESSGFNAAIFEVPDGEEYKSLKWAGNLYRKLNYFSSERMTPILALGGGVIGDLAGFVAATYMRGVPLIQIPTTLLSQVDSSIGGKVAVNHGRLKNSIGAFYQPKLVLSDIATLKTLPGKELKNGLAEIIKYAIIADQGLFKILLKGMQRIKNLDLELIEKTVTSCSRIKSGIIEKDEKDLGVRNILNFGHTFGHAIETVSNFQIAHGNAVAIGMVAASGVAQRMNSLTETDLDAIKTLVVRSGLSIKLPGLNIQKIINAMGHDKKKTGGKVRFVLPKGIGEVFITDGVDSGLVKQVLKEMNEETPDLRHSGGE